jgi:hypothetical protein
MPPNSLEFIAARLHLALCNTPCCCCRRWDKEVKAGYVTTRKCFRCIAKDLYEASEHFNPPHVDAA